MEILRRNIGISFSESGAHVRVWAPNADQVALKLTDDGAVIPLDRQSRGYWYAETDLVKEGCKYWIVLNGEKELPDPASVSQPDGVHGASQALSLNFDWSAETGGAEQWTSIPLKDYVVYELHTGTFSEEGNFDGIAKRLDHLLSLGITAIEIMPVASFPGGRNWGYDGVFPFAVQHTYGGAPGLKNLIELCHQKGLAVVLDVVYNHLGPEGNYLGEFGPYFTNKYKTPWGDAVNFDDRGSHGVRDYYIENALMWFRDFQIDALRLDAVHAIKDFSAVHILQEIRQKADLLMQQTGRVHYLIAESDLNDPKYISPVENNGLGMDAQWVDEFHHALRVASGQPKTGYYSDFNGIEHLAKSYKDAYVYTGMYSEERMKVFGRSADGHAGEQFIVFSQNHDQVGNRMLGERTGTLVSFEMQKLLAAAVVFAPYIPMLFMGEEWGERNPFLYFIDHTDPDLVELVHKGRKEEFAAMHADGEAPDPKREETFLRSKLNWSLLSEGTHQALLDFYKSIIALRKRNVVLSACDRSAVRVRVLADKNALIMERGLTGSNEVVVCLMNFSDKVQELSMPDHVVTCIKVADSADKQWLGPASAPNRINPEAISGSAQISIQPQSFIAYAAFYV